MNEIWIIKKFSTLISTIVKRFERMILNERHKIKNSRIKSSIAI